MAGKQPSKIIQIAIKENRIVGLDDEGHIFLFTGGGMGDVWEQLDV